MFAPALLTFGALHILRATAREHDKKVAAQRHYEHELRARADQQHGWTTYGDERGMYGQCPPAEEAAGDACATDTPRLVN